jgi:hypothetical protein
MQRGEAEQPLTRDEFEAAVRKAYEDPSEVPDSQEIAEDYERYLLYFGSVGVHVASEIPPDGTKRIAVLAF